MTISELMEIQMEQARLKKDRDRLRAALEHIAGEFQGQDWGLNEVCDVLYRIKATAAEALK